MRVIVAGPRNTGKTQLAQAILGQYPDAVLFDEIGPLDQTLAAQLGGHADWIVVVQDLRDLRAAQVEEACAVLEYVPGTRFIYRMRIQSSPLVAWGLRVRLDRAGIRLA